MIGGSTLTIEAHSVTVLCCHTVFYFIALFLLGLVKILNEIIVGPKRRWTQSFSSE